jgi:hypothetical protein
MSIKRDRRFCEHNRVLSTCKICGGNQICEHNKRRYQCQECGGKGVCAHNRQKAQCKECVGASICEHSKYRISCRECGGLLVVAKGMLKGAKNRAKEKQIPFSITICDILELIGDGVCPVLGAPYNISSSRMTNESASLDRFIPALGYTKENCAVISCLANRIKTYATVEQVQQVANWMKNRHKGKL